jgi:2-methylisocitrate lyase-like PEP mutase family enzyme
MDQTAKARLFQQMHLGPEILVIANAWDAASARVFEDAGTRAVGSYTRFHGDAVPYPEANRLFEQARLGK